MDGAGDVLPKPGVRSNRYWTLADLTADFEVRFEFERADERSIVLARTDLGHGMDEGRVKLFFDTRSKRPLKKIEFPTPDSVSFENDAQAQTLLGLNAEGLAQLRAQTASTTPRNDPVDRPFPDRLLTLPATTYEEFAKARPQRVEDGYDKESTVFEETIGFSVDADDGLWFGKTFYDGEGTTGVGGIGVATAAGYQMLRIPELFDWSVSTLMVQSGTIWVGLVRHPEGPDHSGGLLEYDRRSRRATVHAVPDIINRIDDGLFVSTTHGLYVIRGRNIRRLRMEPAIDGKMVVVAEP